MRAGEGTFFGLGVLHTFSANFTEAPYSLLAKGVKGLNQRVQMPFSLINIPSVNIPGFSPAFMEITPAWVWSDNAYMVMRNEAKYASRDKAKRHNLGMGDLQRYPYEVLRPSIVNLMIKARDALRAVDPASVQKASVGNKVIHYYTGKQIPGLGKNFLLEENRQKAIDAYTRIIQYYALKGLFAEVQRTMKEPRPEDVETLLVRPSDNLRWEHERRVIVTELPHLTIADGLQQLAELQEQLAREVLDSKKKDNRGVEIIPDYDESHTPAEADKFVKQTAAAAQQLREQVNTLVQRLQTAGLEQATLPSRVDLGPAERPSWPMDADLAAAIRQVTGTAQQPAAVIYGRPAGLAIGIALQQIEGQALRRFVVRNENEEQFVKDHVQNLKAGELIRAWQSPEDFDQLVQLVKAQLERSGVAVEVMTVLPGGASLSDQLLFAVQVLQTQLRIAGLEPRTAAEVAEQVYKRFT